MAFCKNNKAVFDFDCPQYVDFLTDLNGNTGQFSFGESSPMCRKTCDNDPVSENIVNEAEENQLVNKMTAALSIIQNTPKLKKVIMKDRLFSEQAPSEYTSHHQVKTVMKPRSQRSPRSLARLRSKSVCVAGGFHTEKKLPKPKIGKPKRSSSLNDLRIAKKHTFPKTPVCLKRTIKAKAKEALKTTEELELEQIAQLQKELAQILRNNEISYRRLKQKSGVQKKVKPENFKGTSGINAENKPRRNLQSMSRAAIKKEAQKLDAIVNSKDVSTKGVPTDVLDKSKNPSVSSSMLSEDFNKSKTTASKQPLKFRFHSGLVFHDKVKKSTIVKPFSFDVKNDEAKSHDAGHSEKSEISLSKSVSNPNVNEGKENIPAIKPKPVVKKLMDLQNIKSDIKQLKSNKKIVRLQFGNSVRGFPLAENVLRN